MRRILFSAVLAVSLGAAYGSSARGQHLFLDSDGDGAATAQDRLGASGASSVDLWLVTDRSRNGAEVRLPLGSQPLTINSYEFVLSAVGGTVAWGAYTNHQPTMNVSFGRHESETEIYIGYGGMEPLNPGKYKLGTPVVQVTSGSPELEFRTRSSIHAGSFTSFGSRNSGKDNDHTLKFTEDRSKLGNVIPDEPGDWADADGLAKPSSGGSLASSLTSDAGGDLAVLVSRTGGSLGSVRFGITTGRAGPLRVRLFDVHGRLVRSLLSDEQAPAGTRVLDVPQSPGMASGIYLYRVESVQGIRTGRFAIIH